VEKAAERRTPILPDESEDRPFLWGWVVWPLVLVAGLLLAVLWARRQADVQPVRLVAVWGAPGLHDGHFNKPRSIDFAPNGDVYVVDRSRRIQRFTPEGRFVSRMLTPSVKFGNPRGLDVAPDGTVYVADTHYSRILVFDPKKETHVREFGRHGRDPGEFIWVTDVARDSRGFLWTCEYQDMIDRLQKFTPEGHPVLQVGRFGAAPGQFARPQGLAINRRDEVFVADGVNHRVQRVSPEGRVIETVGKPGRGRGRLWYPYDVALDAQERLYVADFGNNKVVVFAPDGRFLTEFGGPGRKEGRFDEPWGVNVDRQGFIYVADTRNDRVQKFSPLPERLR
jgi:DNA-binding beta-propeller fold protein YncE